MISNISRANFFLGHYIDYDISDTAYCFPFFGPFNTTAFETMRHFDCRCLDRLGLSETTGTLQSVFFFLFYPLLTFFSLFSVFVLGHGDGLFSYRAVVLTDNIMDNQNRKNSAA